MVPVVAGLALGLSNAELAIAWLMASFVFLPPYLLVVRPVRPRRHVIYGELRTPAWSARSRQRYSLSALLYIGCLGARQAVLRIFGSEYSRVMADPRAVVPAGSGWCSRTTW